MAKRRRTLNSKKSKKNPMMSYIQEHLFNTQTMPLIFVFSILGILFVLIRMKGIEQDYKYSDISKRVNIQHLKNKELKADRARRLSVKTLKGFAKKYDLREPNEKKVILIP